MIRFRSVLGWLLVLHLSACTMSQTGSRIGMAPTTPMFPSERPAFDRLLTSGDIQVAQVNLRELGFDPGPINGVYTEQTQAAVRAFQARYGSEVSGLLDYQTRMELIPGLDSKPSP